MFIEEVQKGGLAEIWNKTLFKNQMQGFDSHPCSAYKLTEMSNEGWSLGRMKDYRTHSVSGVCLLVRT